MKAEIITIGDEILIGQIVDTNSAWIARQLNLTGIEVYQITSVHDHLDHMLGVMEEAGKRSDVVLITGGLGPTRDDITRKALCMFFGTGLVFDPATLDRITERFKNRGIPLNRLNRDQAMVPEGCTVIPNTNGTAPGMWFERNKVIYVAMPGVPYEMEAMMSREILPRLKATGKTRAIFHKTILTQGVPESLLAEKIESWENRLPPHIKLAYLPGPMAVRLRLTAMGEDLIRLQRETEDQISELIPLIADSVYGFDDDTLAMAVGRMLTEKKMNLSVAESCTGGFISHQITLTPGSSVWFAGSVTAYANDIKSGLLGCDPLTIARHGAVSRETALEMAMGIKKSMKTDFAISTTGIAGPSGGTPEKPVGTVWIAVAGPAKFICEKFVFGTDRERNIVRSSQTALQLLRRLILEESFIH